jgi:hypothetical protein
MICPTKPIRSKTGADLVIEALEQLDQSELTLQLLTQPHEEAEWDKQVKKRHYLKEHRLVGESLRYVAKLGDKPVAYLGWSSAAFHLQVRDCWIGWTEPLRKARRSLVACNARFVLLGPKSADSIHLASRILSLNLRRLSQDWQHRYGHPIALAETFVDPGRFEGTCYRAANWEEIGVTKGFGRTRLDFYQLHAKPKAIFLYPLVPNAAQILSAPVMPPDWAPYQLPTDPREYPLSGRQTKSLLQALQALRDPRHRRGRHRQVASIVAIATAAMIAGNNTLLHIGFFSQSLDQNQLRSLHATRSRKTGKFLAPSESTIRRVLQRLDPDELDRIVSGWLRSHLDDLGIAHLAVDGKCLRTASKINGQSLQLFGALDVQTKLICRQIQIPSKTNEITTLKDLLQDLDLRGALVSADALNTQKASARTIVEEKQADYLLVVKANQPKLFDRLAELSTAPTGVFFPSAHHAAPSPRSS